MAKSDQNPSPSARRKQRQRDLAKREFGVVSVTFDLTPKEQTYLRQAFIKRFGHDWTLTARREHAMKQDSAKNTLDASVQVRSNSPANLQTVALPVGEAPQAQSVQLALFT